MKPVEFIILLACCLGAYFIGSIPVGYIVARIAGIEDIRNHGSGNIGATNVARTLGVRYFLPVFLLDFAKAYGTMALAACVSMSPIVLYATAAAYLVGNSYSLFLHGTGGKGVAASAGILAYLEPYLLIPLFATWGLMYSQTHIAGIASVGAAIVAPFCAFMLGMPLHSVAFVAVMSSWIIWRHAENIKNYLALS